MSMKIGRVLGLLCFVAGLGFLGGTAQGLWEHNVPGAAVGVAFGLLFYSVGLVLILDDD